MGMGMGMGNDGMGESLRRSATNPPVAIPGCTVDPLSLGL